jgi:hypothetical protein
MSTSASDLGELPLGAESEPGGPQAFPDVAESPPFRLRPGPIVVVFVLALAFLFVPGLVVDTLADFMPLPVFGASLPRQFVDHTVMLLMALGLVAVARRRTNADYALHLPHGRSYIATAIVLSILFGIAMAIVDYAHYVSPLDYGSSGANVAGWMVFQGLFTGPTEEIPYRALLVTYLTVTMPGTLHFQRLSMNGAGVVVAAIFAFFAVPGAFIALPFLVAIAQVSYVFLFGVFLAYWLEKSGSVMAPAVGKCVAFGVRQALLFAMAAVWR